MKWMADRRQSNASVSVARRNAFLRSRVDVVFAASLDVVVVVVVVVDIVVHVGVCMELQSLVDGRGCLGVFLR